MGDKEPDEGRRLEDLTGEVRMAGTEMRDPEARRGMSLIAWGYSLLADFARKRATGQENKG
jgi:hypothetical protein